jgi:hypothetical protein
VRRRNAAARRRAEVAEVALPPSISVVTNRRCSPQCVSTGQRATSPTPKPPSCGFAYVAVGLAERGGGGLRSVTVLPNGLRSVTALPIVDRGSPAGVASAIASDGGARGSRLADSLPGTGDERVAKR